MNSTIQILGLSLSSSVVLYSSAFLSSLGLSLVLVPFFRRVALRLGVLDKPGGRKEHGEATPLFGGAAVMAAFGLGLAVIVIYQKLSIAQGGPDLKLGSLNYMFIGSLIIFITGLIDDLVGERLPFYYKLVGQIVGSSAALVVLYHEQLIRLITEDVPFADYLYLLVLMGWMLTVINSFNFSDNINGLSPGLAVIALFTAMVYLGTQMNLRYVVLGFLLAGSILGFMPYNFPRAKIFLGDAGSMFIGYWVALILWPLGKGFFDGNNPLYGLDYMIPPVLVMGVPLYDAAFVVFMRWREKRPIYLGDNKHLSHRLVRCGFSRTESTLILWGVAFIMGGIGAMSMTAPYYTRYMAFLVAMAIMLIITVLVVKKEKKTISMQEANNQSESKTSDGSRRIRADVSS